MRQYYITCTHPGRYAYYMRAYHTDITLHVHIIKRPSIGNLSATIGNRSTTYSIEHPLTIYRIPIERPSVIYWLSTNRSISSIYRKTIGNLSDIYQTPTEHLSLIYRTSIEHPTRIQRHSSAAAVVAASGPAMSQCNRRPYYGGIHRCCICPHTHTCAHICT